MVCGKGAQWGIWTFTISIINELNKTVPWGFESPMLHQIKNKVLLIQGFFNV